MTAPTTVHEDLARRSRMRFADVVRTGTLGIRGRPGRAHRALADEHGSRGAGHDPASRAGAGRWVDHRRRCLGAAQRPHARVGDGGHLGARLGAAVARRARRADGARSVPRRRGRPIPGRGARLGGRRTTRHLVDRGEPSGVAGQPVVHRDRHSRTDRTRARHRPLGAHRIRRGRVRVRDLPLGVEHLGASGGDPRQRSPVGSGS